jgi:magnesium-transporting ATPase (P-type)
VNLVALFIVFTGAVIFTDTPFTAVQMLWVNIIMDTFAALALATEKPTDELLDRQPNTRFEKIVNPIMWRNIIGQGIYQVIILMTMLIFGQTIFSLPFDAATPFYAVTQDPGTGLTVTDPTNKCYLYTMIFQAFVFMQLFNQIAARKLGERELNVFSGFFANPIFLFIAGITFVIQILMV